MSGALRECPCPLCASTLRGLYDSTLVSMGMLQEVVNEARRQAGMRLRRGGSPRRVPGEVIEPVVRLYSQSRGVPARVARGYLASAVQEGGLKVNAMTCSVGTEWKREKAMLEAVPAAERRAVRFS